MDDGVPSADTGRGDSNRTHAPNDFLLMVYMARELLMLTHYRETT
jgi:hypothetical protein